jgi:signal recognition particle subunit SRP54
MFTFLSQKFSGILEWLTNKGRLTEENIKEAENRVRDALIEADVPLHIVEAFLAEIAAEVVGKQIQTSLNPGQQFVKIVHDKLLAFLGGRDTLTAVTFQIPSVIMVMGLQGSGKTTTIAKIAQSVAQQAQQRGKKRYMLLASIDFYRPAAIDQLEVLAGKIQQPFYRAKSTNPLAAAKEIYDHFKANHYELLFLDTAGRLHIDEEMMAELRNVTAKLAPKHKILVLDAMTGQESLNVAQAFDQAIGFDAAILTKMDSDARGGAAFAFRYALKKPIAWVGTGEKIEDLEQFVPERMATRILGMGDLQTLLEKAAENIPDATQDALTKRLMDGAFSLQDFYDQLSMIDKMGSLQKVSRYLPGTHTISPEMMEKGQVEMKKFRAIITSMTAKEKMVPQILDGSRKKRIAQGAGVNVQDINQLLQRFEQSKQFVKMFKKMGKLNRFF